MFETEENESRPAKSSKQVVMSFTGSFSIGKKTYEFEANKPFEVSSQKDVEAFDREIKRRGLLDGSITN